MDDKVMRIVYTFFLGALLALFVGLGIQTFYPGPQMPDPPPELGFSSAAPPDELPPEQEELQREHARRMEQWQEDRHDHDRNVATVSLAASVLLLVLSLVFEKRNKVLTNGVMLGGLFTLIYAIGRGFASQETAMTFAAVSVGLVVVLFLGWRRFFQERRDPRGSPAADRTPQESTGA